MTVQPHRPHTGILLQLGLSDNPVIGLVGAPELILGLPVAGGEQKDNVIAAPPNTVGCIILSIADMLSHSVTMRSHGDLLSGILAKSVIRLVCHHDQPCTMIKSMAIEAPIKTAINVRISRSVLQGKWDLLNILPSSG
jgi:hypothetical protein